MRMMFIVHASVSNIRSQNGVNGRAANGQSLRRQNGETMGQYLRRTGESVVGATGRTRGRAARVVQNPRGRSRG